MLFNQITKIYYSNGIEVFGPMSFEDFSKNKYYSSTLVWYKGLKAWMPIENVKEFRHLIGTLPTPNLDEGRPKSLVTDTPPLDKIQFSKSKSTNTILLVIVALIIVAIGIYLYTVYQEEQMVVEPTTDNSIVFETEIIPEVDIIDSSDIHDAEKYTYRENWQKFISVSPNDYKNKEVGGIEDLKIKIANSSPYPIDSVKVKISYLKSNGEVFQTETLQFDNIPAKGNKELFAPDSKRGVKVLCSILTLHSKELQICYDKKKNVLESDMNSDPYYCE